MLQFLCSKSAFLLGTSDFLLDAPKNCSFELEIAAGILLSSPRGIFSCILREEGMLCEEGKIWQFWCQGGCCVCCDGKYIRFWWMVCVLLDGGSMNESGAHNPVVCGAFCVFVSILLLYFCTYLGSVRGRRPPAGAHCSCLWCVLRVCIYQTMLLLYIPLSRLVLFSKIKVIYQYLRVGKG